MGMMLCPTGHTLVMEVLEASTSGPTNERHMGGTVCIVNFDIFKNRHRDSRPENAPHYLKRIQKSFGKCQIIVENSRILWYNLYTKFGCHFKEAVVMWQYDKVTNTFVPGILPAGGSQINVCYTRLSQENELDVDSGSILNQESIGQGGFHPKR
ncbi:hypothetical protein [uncultured Oscillibacter sp.]|uniref:hypothetical protein n=1 Tax=uncultured Oscillibacter sp. TaxID=876091 RepID=UPI002608462D|nr:hypothetical protein [uncultured Oscillibacter sp.]